MSQELQQRLARQLAEQTGVEVRCGSARAVLSAGERDQFRV